VATDKQKGCSNSSAMDTGELGEHPTHNANGELLVQELHSEEEGPLGGPRPELQHTKKERV
jgi:hypothetical protein